MKSVPGRHGIGLFPGRQNALELGFHRVRTHWIPGFMALEPGFPGVRTHWIPGFMALEPGSRVRQNALEPGFHCVRTHWIRGFMAFRRARRTRIVRLMVPVGPESGFRPAPPGASGSDVTSWHSVSARRLTEDIRPSGSEPSGMRTSGSAALSSAALSPGPAQRQ